MRRLVIYVYKCSTDIRQDLDLVLQLLTEIVGFPEGSVGVHDYVNLDVIVLIMGELSFDGSVDGGMWKRTYRTALIE